MKLKKLIYSAICLALCMILPFLTGQIPQVGAMLSPLHIPVLLCGFLCGAPYACIVGLITPLLRFFLFSMPPLFPVGLAMTFELATYGLLSGILYHKFPKGMKYLLTSLIISMIGGRIVWGITMAVIAGTTAVTFSFQMFIMAAFTNAIPGIICHIIIIPLIILALRKAGIHTNE